MFHSFAEHYGIKRPVADVRRADVSSWLVSLAKKSNVSSTRNGKATHLTDFFGFITFQGHYPADLPNPAENTAELSKNERKKRAEKYGWIPFTQEQLELLFHPENLERSEKSHTRRGLVIGLYTGARVSEVAKLKVSDFVVVDGVHCIQWNGHFKTETTNRLVPIHPDLIRLGLLDWVAEQKRRKQSRLFPDVKTDGHNQGGAISKGTTHLIGLLGLQVPENSENCLGFHSFRSNVIQALQAAEPPFPEERRRAYTGHGEGDTADRSSHKTNYMRAWKPNEISALHAGIPWGKWLDFAGLHAILSPHEITAEAIKDKRLKTRRANLAKKQQAEGSKA